jgi:membrane-associated phospholipid phosphatase
MRAAAMSALLVATSLPALSADDSGKHRTLAETCTTRTTSFFDDVQCYVTAPIRWDQRDWIYFGGTVAAIAIAHHYDEDVRTHFVGDAVVPPSNSKSYDTEDALPAAGVFAATLLYATVTWDPDGRSETWQMLEAAGFSSATSYLLKYAAGRERPDVTNDPNQWRSGGDSFPSLHTTAAFAIGTVLAESGNDRYRWVRRFLGYGMAGYTGYARLKHNAHWLSDTVAGAGIGVSTAHFVINRHAGYSRVGQLNFVPLQGGVMMTYNVVLP